VSDSAPRVGFVSLGCPKALVDSERILTQLRSEGYDVVGTYESADLVVVNTAASSMTPCTNHSTRSARPWHATVA
jgi:ribosomal protein S12 methylthiotransferase